MAKNNGFGKILAGIGVIGAGVALGLAIYSRFDVIRRELNDDEFEDDPDDEGCDDNSSDDDTSRTYVTINASSDEEGSEETDDSPDEE